MGTTMNIEQFAWRMIELMPQLVRGFAHHENNYLTQGKITLPQFWALDYLQRQGRSAMSRVAQFLGISRPAMTGIIDRLISQELVARINDQHDRRIVWIEITAKGRNIIRKILAQKHRALVHIFSRLSATERMQHLRFIEKTLSILDSQKSPRLIKKE